VAKTGCGNAVLGVQVHDARLVATMRLKLLKIGALVRITVRRVWVSFSSGYPHQALFARVFQQLHC
jgi:hypothetical protein